MLMDIIKSRHSIRKYTDEQISREALEKILEAGNYAPSAGGGAWDFLLHNITGRGNLCKRRGAGITPRMGRP